MLLINIHIVQGAQRLVGPTESDTGGGEGSPGDPAGHGVSASACPTQARSWAAGAAPALGIRELSGNAGPWGEPGSAGQGCGELETSPAPESLGWE